MVFYTYMWLHADGTPYYVGKGKGNRAFRKGGPCRSRVLVQNWSSETEALEMEKYYTHLFGRVDLGTGILTNRNEGGFGGTLPPYILSKFSKLYRERGVLPPSRKGAKQPSNR